MRLRFGGGAIQVIQPDGKIIYSENFPSFLADFKQPFTLTFMDGIGAYEYNDAQGMPAMLGPETQYFANNGQALQIVPGPWAQGDAVLALFGALIANRNLRLGLTPAKMSDAVVALDAALKRL